MKFHSCWVVHLWLAHPWEVLHLNTQHWQLYVTQTDSTVHSYDKTGQLCISPHIPLVCSMNTVPHQPLQNITRLPLQAPNHPLPFSLSPNPHLICRQAPHLSRRPLAVPSDYIKKSSPLSGPSWPCYTKCYCQGQLGERRGCCYWLGFDYKQMRSL